GRVETTDAGYWETSLRETGEELGVRTGRIRPLGRLPHTPVFVSRYVIHPFVGWLPYAPRIRADPREVARVLEVSVASLGDANAVYEEEWEIRGSRRLVSFYRFDEMVVWGATARILSELAARLFGGRPGQMSPGAVLPAREVSG
ncbi:MAG TPA: CoA pyrophosphatase, partial [Chloroflexota bacterium]|nr:CoA pyrophosphatase [Chloroflexota bacterium]